MHARRAGDEGQQRVLAVPYAQALHYGPTPVQEGIRRCTELLEEHPAAPTFEAGLGTDARRPPRDGGQLRRGPRGSTQTPIAVYEEFGLRFRRAVRSIVGAQIETLAGDLDAAERELRTGYAMLEEMGEHGVRSTVAGFLADVLSLRPDDGEAEHFVAIARETAAREDVVPQVLWRRAACPDDRPSWRPRPAAALARRRRVEQASTTDFLDLRAGTQLVAARRGSAATAGSATRRRGSRRRAALYAAEGKRARRSSVEAVAGAPRLSFLSRARRRTITPSKEVGDGRAASTRVHRQFARRTPTRRSSNAIEDAYEQAKTVRA